MNPLDYALGGVLAVLAVLLVGRLLVRANDGALSAYVHTGTTRRTRRYDAGTVRPLRRLPVEGQLLPAVQDDGALVPYSGGGQLAPYAPNPPVIRLPSADTGPGWELTRSTPNRQPTVASDFTVPALQAAMTAVAFGIMAGLLAWALAWSWRVPVAVCGLAFGVGWLWRLRIVDGLLWRIEAITRHDLDGDGVAGQPQPQRGYTLLNPSDARTEAAKAQREDEGTARRAELLAFLHRCYTVGTASRKHGVTAGSGEAYTQYNEHRAALFTLGLAKWKGDSPNAGWVLTLDEAQAVAVITKHVG